MTPHRHNRREFFRSVGRGMIVASVGYSAALDMRLTPAWADEAAGESLRFGKLEPLVALMQETPAEKVLPLLVGRLQSGTSLKELVTAAALANARAFGGEDYVGFHTLMALMPAYKMAHETPEDRRPLPVLKVLYRNTNRLQEKGGGKAEVLKAVKPASLPSGSSADALREIVHRRDMAAADQTLAAIAADSADRAWNDLLPTVHESTDVHRVVLAHRAWDMIDLVGKENALTMLRQSLHYCVRNEESAFRYSGKNRDMLPKLLTEYKLEDHKRGTRKADDAWIDRMSQTLFASTPRQAAETVAAALKEGFSHDALAEAIAVAANQLVLRDSGRPVGQTAPNKPAGSVHGDSIGVHACDSANAWKHIARVSNQRNAVASLILAGYQVALDRAERGGDFLNWKPRPYQEQLDKVTAKDADGLIHQLDGAIRAQDQALACAATHRYGELGFDAKAVFNLLRRYATSEDGALHAEKYYWTVSDEFASVRAAFRWRQLVALARVTASEFGQPAPGYDEACRLLKLKA